MVAMEAEARERQSRIHGLQVLERKRLDRQGQALEVKGPAIFFSIIIVIIYAFMVSSTYECVFICSSMSGGVTIYGEMDHCCR